MPGIFFVFQLILAQGRARGCPISIFFVIYRLDPKF